MDGMTLTDVNTEVRRDGLSHSEAVMVSTDLSLEDGVMTHMVYDSDLGWYTETYRQVVVNVEEIVDFDLIFDEGEDDYVETLNRRIVPILGDDPDGPCLTVTRHAGLLVVMGPWLDRPLKFATTTELLGRVSTLIRDRLAWGQ
jgi:hypothetical protein